MKSFVCFLLFFAVVFSCKNEKKETSISEADLTIERDTVKAQLSFGTLERIKLFPSKFIQPRTVDVWLPENYSDSKKYAVLYMNDGQMLFDSTTTWNHQEWKVDEVATKLMHAGVTKDFIVVAPHNIPETRHSDYYPQKPFESLTKHTQDSIFADAKKNKLNFENINSDAYLKFLVDELKPYIDAHFSVLTDQQNTFIAGSSMGGLISMYAVCEYPQVFEGAACLSTHWPGGMPSDSDLIPITFFKYLEANLPSPSNHTFYFDFGTKTLDAHYPKYEAEVNRVFKLKGYTDSNFKNLKFEGADHSELSWQKRLDIPLAFLLKK